MLIRVVGAKEPPFHVPTFVAKDLVSRGICEDATPVVKRLSPQTTWQVRSGTYRGSAPILYAYCSSCGVPLNAEGPTAHKTARFIHSGCGKPETCPLHVAAEYVKARARYDRGEEDLPYDGRRRAVGHPYRDANRHHYRHQGHCAVNERRGSVALSLSIS